MAEPSAQKNDLNRLIDENFDSLLKYIDRREKDSRNSEIQSVYSEYNTWARRYHEVSSMFLSVGKALSEIADNVMYWHMDPAYKDQVPWDRSDNNFDGTTRKHLINGGVRVEFLKDTYDMTGFSTSLHYQRDGYREAEIYFGMNMYGNARGIGLPYTYPFLFDEVSQENLRRITRYEPYENSIAKPNNPTIRKHNLLASILNNKKDESEPSPTEATYDLTRFESNHSYRELKIWNQFFTSQFEIPITDWSDMYAHYLNHGQDHSMTELLISYGYPYGNGHKRISLPIGIALGFDLGRLAKLMFIDMYKDELKDINYYLPEVINRFEE